MDHLFLPMEELAIFELKRDRYFDKVPSKDLSSIIKSAASIGKDWAIKIRKMYPDKSFHHIAREHGLKIIEEDKELIIGDVVFYSEFYSGKKEILIYKKAVEAWAVALDKTYEECKELFIAHEFFHYLECEKIGLLSNIYKVTIFKIAGFNWKSGVKALSEIGAHSFVKHSFKMEE